MKSRTSLHTPVVKMTSIKIGIKPDLKLMTIFWMDNQKLVSHVWERRKSLAHQLRDGYGPTYTHKSLLRI
ncbi:MAG TPA: hypothetical protein VFI64_01685 [Nitrososphaeraceae archaeon]|nr:hypothetical protein [Nitrososphaeraceae archaeon]